MLNALVQYYRIIFFVLDLYFARNWLPSSRKWILLDTAGFSQKKWICIFFRERRWVTDSEEVIFSLTLIQKNGNLKTNWISLSFLLGRIQTKAKRRNYLFPFMSTFSNKKPTLFFFRPHHRFVLTLKHRCSLNLFCILVQQKLLP